MKSVGSNIESVLPHFVSGMPVYESAMAMTRQQYRFPISKGKRIRKKWAKRDKNFKGVPGAFMLPRSAMSWSSTSDEKCLIIHPLLFARLKDQLKKQEEAYEQKWR